MSTTRTNWKKHKARTAQVRRSTQGNMALMRSRAKARELAAMVDAGQVTDARTVLATAQAMEDKEMRGTASHQALSLALKALNRQGAA